MESGGLWWMLMDSDGFQWILMDSDGFKWILMDFDGFQWIQIQLLGCFAGIIFLGCEGLLTPDNPSGGENAFRSERNGGVLVIAGRLGSKMEIRSPRIPTLAGFGRLLGNLFLGPRYAICLVFCEICKIST